MNYWEMTEEEEEAGDQRKGNQKITSMSDDDVPISFLRSGVRDTRSRK